MAKFGTNTSSPQETGVDPTPKKDGNGWFKKNQRSILAVALIAVIAFVIRFIFVYSTSANSGFALSDGSDHLHNITQILAGSIPYGIDYSMNYPYGAVNTLPLLTDLIISLFAMIGTAAGMTAAEAASAALSWSAVIFGTLACITAYFVGKELFNSRKAGYLASLFLALCPIVIGETVFSNGTTAAAIEFYFLVMVYFLVKGIKLMESSQKTSETFKDIFIDNKKAMAFYAAMVGLFLTIIALSWNGFRSIITVMIFLMAIQALVDRFRGKDVRPLVVFYSIPIVITLIISAVYYICGGLWDAVFSGVFLGSLIALVACYVFAFTQKKPWTLTLPIIALVTLALFLVLFFAAPAYFNVIVCGNSTYAAGLAALMGPTGLSISKMATGFGPATFWFAFIMIGMLLWRLPKSVSSPLYVFTLVFMCFCTFYAFVNVFNATVFSIVFALGFACVILWIFDHVDFKAYFTSFRGSDFKTIWKKIVKPLPFVTIIAIVLLICAPNAMYAIDAGIPSNNNDDYEGALGLGTSSYYVKDSKTYKTNDVLSTYASESKDGAMVTWMEYANDVSSYGKFCSVADINGYGEEAVSNILLANGSNGESTAAMIIYLINYIGVDKCKDLLVGHGLTEEQYATLEDVIKNPGNFRNVVLTNTDIYGILSPSVSDLNITYIYGKQLLTQCCNAYTISSMYEILVNNCSKNISYFMITYDMFPMYYSYSSTFRSLAVMNGYQLGEYSEVLQYETVNYYTLYYTGMYSYTDAMYNSLFWRAFIGMSPEEAGFGSSISSSYSYITALMLSDGTTKAVPGYGLGNYVVDYSHLYVDYNKDSNATLSSDGWTKMLYNDAIEKQSTDGGLINYLAGYPVILKYVSNSVGTEVTGTVVDYNGEPVSGIRLTVTDSNGVVRSTTTTSADGKYSLFVTDTSSTIEVYAASTTLVDGVLIKTYKYSEMPSKITVPATKITGTIVDGDGIAVTESNVKMTLTGTTTGKVYTLSAKDGKIKSDMTFDTGNIVPDTYDISVTSLDGNTEYATTTYTTAIGDNIGLDIEFSVYKITVTVNNEAGGQIEDGVVVKLVSIDGDRTFSGVVESGKAIINVYAGSYMYYVDGTAISKTYTTTSDAITVSAAASKTIKVVEGKEVTITGVPEGLVANIYGSPYMKSFKMDSIGKIVLPNGTAGGAFYSVYSVDYGKNVYWSMINGLSCTVSSEAGNTISGTVSLSTEKTQTATIRVIDQANNGREMTVSTGSDGTYSLILPNGTYTLYIVNGSESLITTLTVEGELSDNNYTTVESTNITGNVYWTTTSYAISYAPVKVDSITGKDGIVMNFMTDVSGSYSFYVPKDASCNVTVTLDSSMPYYFGSESEKTYTKTETVSSTQNFSANTEKLTVKNDSEYTIKVSSTSIEPGETAEISIASMSVSVSIDTTIGGIYYYYSGTVYVLPSKTVKSIVVTPTEYYKVTVTGLETTDTVSITALNDDFDAKKVITSTGTERSWYLEKSGSFEITMTNSDSSKIMYYTVDMTEDRTVEAKLTDTVYISGYVGVADDGDLYVKYSGQSHKFSIDSSGRYDISLPLVDEKYELSVEINKDSEDDPYYHTESPVVIDGGITGGKSYVYNIAVVGGEEKSTDKVDVNITSVTMDDVTVDAKKVINVAFQFNLVRETDGDLTYLLKSGDNWSTLLFYSDAEMTSQITSVKMTGSELTSSTVYAKGTVLNENACLNSESFSVIVNDINGNEAGVGMFTDSTSGWKKTTASDATTVLDYGVDKVADSEYSYSVKISNKDNFNKSFKVVLNTDLSEKWFVRYVYNDVIYSNADNVIVNGYTDLTVYVKITAKNSVSDLSLSEVKIAVSSNDSMQMSTTTEGISVAEDKLSAEYTSKPMSSAVKITKTSTDGRGVIDVKSDLPNYVWFIAVIIILAMILLVWLSIRRGVFSRKK